MDILRRNAGEKQESSTELNVMRDSLDMGRFADDGRQNWTSQPLGYSYHVRSENTVKEFGDVPV